MTLTPEQAAGFRNDGYTIARGVFDAAALERLRSACDELCAHARSFAADTFVGVTFFNIHRNADPFAKDISSHAAVPGLIRRVTYPYALSAELNSLRTHAPLLRAVASLLGPNLKQIVNQVNFNPPGAGTGWGWHQDYRFRKPGIPDLPHGFVQTLVAIDLCSTWTGGLRVVPGSHRLGDLALDLDTASAETHFDVSEAVTPELHPGDVIFFNSHLIHGSTANKSPHQRRVYINGFASDAASVGMPVMRDGVIISAASGRMEYEGDQDTIPKASKY